jgi:type IV pilus biogenesis protein PilP
MPPQAPKRSPKQTITLVLVVIVFAIVAWQVYGLIMPEGGSAPAPVANTVVVTKAGAPASSGSPSSLPAPEMLQPKQAPVQVNTELLRLQQETEAKYISALNELEMLKVQRQIAETKESITAATLATATAEKSITDLLTVQQMPSAGGGNSYTSTAIAPASPSMPAPTTSTAPTPAPAPRVVAAPEAPYTLQSVSYKDQRWNAVLSLQEKQYSVTVGDVLAPDECTVGSIDRNSVVLVDKNKKMRRIMMSSSI